MNIRLTKVEDVNVLPEIESSAGETFRDLPHLAWIADDENMSIDLHLKYVLQGTSWVAEADEMLVGFLCAEAMARDLHVWELAVRQEWQGLGIGRQLMKTVIEHARLHKFGAVTLTTFRDVAWNEPFYQSLGFKRIDEVNTGSRFEKILLAETEHGLPRELRCAMVLSLSEPGSQTQDTSSWTRSDKR